MITLAELDSKEKCFAAPNACSDSWPKCLGCADNTQCAKMAALLVYSIQTKAIHLSSDGIYGLPSTKHFSKFLSPAFRPDAEPISNVQDLLYACHHRHLVKQQPVYPSDDDFEQLLIGLAENEEAASQEAASQPEALIVTTKPGDEIHTLTGCDGESVSQGELDGPRYPSLPIHLGSVEHDELVQRIAGITARYNKNRDYLAVREEFVQASLALNQHRQLAPAFRRQPRIPFRKDQRNSGHEQLLIDQIVIDCHWLWCRKERVLPKNQNLKHLFDPDVLFDCNEVRASIAAKKWVKSFRVSDMFRLTRLQQHQCVQLQTEECKAHYKLLVDGKAGRSDKRIIAPVSTVRSAINEWSQRNHRIRSHEEVYEKLWLSRELLRAPGLKLDFTAIAKLAGLMLGQKPLDRKTVKGKLDGLDVVLDQAYPALAA